jgi:hypothetical protein
LGNTFLFSGDIVEEIDTNISSSREVVVVEASLGGMKRHNETDTSNSNKKLVPFKNPDITSSHSQLVIWTPLTGLQEVK